MAVLGLALIVDRLGELPTLLHPVGWIGALIGWLDRRAPAGTKARLIFGIVLVGLPTAIAGVAQLALSRATNRFTAPARTLAQALLLKWTFSLAMLERSALMVGSDLVMANAPAARDRLRALVSRPTATLPPELVAAGAIESVAENASDSVVAPLFWWLVGGLPAAAIYRAVNTADAMVGYHGTYEQLGRASARVDDLLNLLPSRITAMALCLSTPFQMAATARAVATLRRDHRRTESPNAGWPMSAMAGSLGRRLEKPDHYVLGGQFPPPSPNDICRAVERARFAAALAVIGMGAVRVLVRSVK